MQALFIRMRLSDSDGQQASEFFGVPRGSPITVQFLAPLISAASLVIFEFNEYNIVFGISDRIFFVCLR